MITINKFSRKIISWSSKRCVLMFSNLKNQSVLAKPNVIRWSDLQTEVKHSQQAHSIQLYQKFLKQKQNKPQHWIAHLQLAKIYQSLKQYNIALKHYLGCVKLFPSNGQCHLRMAQCFKKSGDLLESIRYLQIGLENCQNKGELCYKLGEIYCDLQEYTKCFELYYFWKDKFGQTWINERKINFGEFLLQNINDLILNLVIFSGEEKALTNLKGIFLSKEKVRQGIQFFQHIIQKNKTFSSLFTIGSLLFESGSCLDAKSYLQEAYQINKQHYLLNLYLGTICQQQNKLHQAIVYYQKAFSIDSTNSQPLSCLGFVSMNKGNFKKAITFFSRALELNQNDILALTSLGIIQISNNEFTQGIDLLHRAIGLDPTNYLAISRLQSILTILGKEKQLSQLQFKLKNIQK